MSKKGMEFSFTWIFAAFAGAVIIFIAIYAVSAIINGAGDQTNAELTKEFEILLNPLGTNLEEGKQGTVKINKETSIINECDEDSIFGLQKLSVQVNENDVNANRQISQDKYVFSKNIIRSKEFYVFTKPLELPYKIGDLNYIYVDQFCFVNPPESIEREISSLNLKNINITNNVNNCNRQSISVCFSQEPVCKIIVDQLRKEITKDGQTISYAGDELLYAGIFSDKAIYECQIERINKRTNELSKIYSAKSAYMNGQGCTNGLADDLIQYSNLLSNNPSVSAVHTSSENLRRSNELLNCEIF